MSELSSPVPLVRRSVFVDDAAALLGVSRRTVYYRIREGRLRTIRTRGGSQRILLESIEALLREREAKRAARRAASQTQALAFQVEALS
ncbi:MAG TPA: helix-turn-helix domain-containing protein [Vicinamibacterales bacterium]|nr:helix-turn-helix domain-containing protein [Vicinamibacterales bacterium]